MIGWMALAAAISGQAAQAEHQMPPAAKEAVSAVPAASVSGNVVSHSGEKVRIRVPAEAAYAGSERFNLYGVADAEIHVFVEADSAKRMQRLYWVQFESYLPSNDHRYNYADGNTRFDLWGGTPTWLVWGPRLTSAPYRAGGDRESVMRILSKAGYTIPAEVLNVRMVQMLDDPEGSGRGRRELMIIYSEDLAATVLPVDVKVTDAFKPLEKPLIDRATSAVTVERF